jgi:hypothetical protein
MAVKECEEIQAWLSDYLEGTLESGRHRAMEDHLYLCPICLAESESLADTIKSVGNLPLVEPPPGFSRRVMVQVREEAARPGLWERLFLPFRIKVPLQVAMLLLVCILSIYVYQKNEMPQRKISETAPVKAPTTEGEDFRETDLAKAPRAVASLVLSHERARLDDQVASTGTLRSQDALLEETRQSSATLRAEKKEAATSLAGRFELVLQLRSQEEGEGLVQERIVPLVKSFNGQRLQFADAVKKQKPESSLEPQTLWITLPADQFERFKSKLASIGTVIPGQIVPAEPALGAIGPVQLRIQFKILPPVSRK